MINRPSAELKRLAREFLNGNYTILVLVTIIATFTPVIMLAPFSIGVSAELNAATVIYGIAAIIIRLIGELFIVGLMKIHLLLASNQQATFTDLFWAFRNHPDRFILGAFLLYGLMAVPAVPAVLCAFYAFDIKSTLKYIILILTVIALFLSESYIYCTYSQIYPLCIEHPDMTVRTAFRTSCNMMRGNKRKLFFLQLSFLGWQLLGLSSFGIGLLWIYPYITQTYTNFYLDLTGAFDQKAQHIDISISD